MEMVGTGGLVAVRTSSEQGVCCGGECGLGGVWLDDRVWADDGVLVDGGGGGVPSAELFDMVLPS